MSMLWTSVNEPVASLPDKAPLTMTFLVRSGLVPYWAPEMMESAFQMLGCGRTIIVETACRWERSASPPGTGVKVLDQALARFEQSGQPIRVVATTITVSGQPSLSRQVEPAVHRIATCLRTLGEPVADPISAEQRTWVRASGNGDVHIEEALAGEVRTEICSSDHRLRRYTPFLRRAVRSVPVSRRDRLVTPDDLAELAGAWTLRTQISCDTDWRDGIPFAALQTVLLVAAREEDLPSRSAVEAFAGRPSRWWSPRPITLPLERMVQEVVLRSDHHCRPGTDIGFGFSPPAVLQAPTRPGGVLAYAPWPLGLPHAVIAGAAKSRTRALATAILSGALRHGEDNLFTFDRSPVMTRWVRTVGGAFLSASSHQGDGRGLRQLLRAVTEQHEDLFAHWLAHVLGPQPDTIGLAPKLAEILVRTSPEERTIETLLNAVPEVGGQRHRLSTSLHWIGARLPAGILDGANPTPLAIDVEDRDDPRALTTITALVAIALRANPRRQGADRLSIVHGLDVAALKSDEDVWRWLSIHLRLSRLYGTTFLFEFDPNTGPHDAFVALTDVVGTFWIMKDSCDQAGAHVKQLVGRLWHTRMALQVQDMLDAMVAGSETLLLRPQEHLAVRVCTDLQDFVGELGGDELALAKDAWARDFVQNNAQFTGLWLAYDATGRRAGPWPTRHAAVAGCEGRGPWLIREVLPLQLPLTP